jgi:hypothetical protein
MPLAVPMSNALMRSRSMTLQVGINGLDWIAFSFSRSIATIGTPQCTAASLGDRGLPFRRSLPT